MTAFFELTKAVRSAKFSAKLLDANQRARGALDLACALGTRTRAILDANRLDDVYRLNEAMRAGRRIVCEAKAATTAASTLRKRFGRREVELTRICDESANNN